MTTALDPSARYVIVDEIASGGMGSVFLALHSDEDGKTMPVAIKKLHAHLAEDIATVDAFVDEARIAYRLRHPNVVRVHDVVPIDGQLVIVMDWVEGVPMRSLGRAKEDKLPIPVIRRMLVDALEGLHAAHQLKDDRGTKLDVVHRDISPQNLLVGTDGLTRVTDFGIALARGRLAPTTVQGGVKGKIPYLSPEQVNRSKVDHRSDIFAAGVVAWEMLTGKRLFVAPSEGEIMAMILREPLQPPSAIRMDVPLDLDETILKALERNPERRFATAADFARAIAEGGPMASHEEVGRIVATTAGTSLAARRQKLALAAERKTAPRPLQEEMTATFVQPVPVPSASVRPSRVVIEPVSIMTPIVDPTGVATSLPPLPMQPVASRSTTPVLLAVVLALGLAIVIVVKSTGKEERTPTSASFPAAPVIPPPDRRGSNEAAVPVAPSATPSVTVVELGPTPTPVRPAHRPTSHGKRDAGAPRAGQPFMPDDL
jgi:serine/threonine-protein kinase